MLARDIVSIPVSCLRRNSGSRCQLRYIHATEFWDGIGIWVGVSIPVSALAVHEHVASDYQSRVPSWDAALRAPSQPQQGFGAQLSNSYAGNSGVLTRYARSCIKLFRNPELTAEG